MLKCNRCGKRDSEENKTEIFIIAMCEQPAPAAIIDTHTVIDWSVVQDTGFVSCEDCMMEALGLLEAFYGGSKE